LKDFVVTNSLWLRAAALHARGLHGSRVNVFFFFFFFWELGLLSEGAGPHIRHYICVCTGSGPFAFLLLSPMVVPCILQGAPQVLAPCQDPPEGYSVVSGHTLVSDVRKLA
jgi:hypothetical protein